MCYLCFCNAMIMFFFQYLCYNKRKEISGMANLFSL